MKLTQRLKQSMEGLIHALMRYPLTIVFFIVAAAINALSIQRLGVDQHERLLATFVIAALTTLVAQGIYERFFTHSIRRWVLAGGAVLLSALYYLTMLGDPDFSLIIFIRTGVLVLALTVGFIWIPTMKSKFQFDQSFLIVFKSFFNSVFFAAVIMVGVSLIIGAADQLLFNLSYRAYPHAANIIFVIFAPMYFLSLIPKYHAEDKEAEGKVKWSRFLEVLVAYIIIPLVSLFTVILVLYILLNIRGDFWTDNLLEPMLVTYSIVVIFVYVLAGTLENKLVEYFKRIFPKVLLPIVFFQTMASFLKIQEEGLTHGRYFVILYGVFAIVSGILFSLYKGKKNGAVAILLMVFSILSIMPPVDAFSVSRRIQISQLEAVLGENEMLVEGEIRRAEELSEEDRRLIRSTTSYIDQMNYTEELDWIPEDFNYYRDFEEVFGITPQEWENERAIPRYRSFQRAQEEVLDIGAYNYMIQVQFTSTGEDREPKEIILNGETYRVGWEGGALEGFFVKAMESNLELVIPMEEITDRLLDRENGHQQLSQEEAAFYTETGDLSMGVVVNYLDIQEENGQKSYNGDVYILLGGEE